MGEVLGAEGAVAVLVPVVREGFPENMRLEARLEGSEGISFIY